MGIYFLTVLKDPFSVQYEFGQAPFKAYLREAPDLGGKPTEFGYMVYVNVNTKNSFGEYTGAKS
ncbi:MAG: hypothetical protein IIA70_08930, partial [Proteobacteria bacterium]|nr:hypothetical protein [Pseudomonadota bacterium]